MTHANPPRAHCPLCGGGALSGFYSRDGVPVTCASVFTDSAQARAVARGNIDLAACESCGFAFNRRFDPHLGELGARYESSQAASPRFNAYAAAIAQSWVARHGLQGKTVLEVGCGDGNFLSHLMSAGVGHCIGVDPLMDVAGAVGGAREGVELMPRLFDATMLDIRADALVCRHTLEHVPDVRGFLTLVRRWAARVPGRVVLFDLPDAGRVFAERAFWDIYYEHCNYFTAATLRRAFEVAGLRIVSTGREFQGQYLRLDAVADPATGHPAPADSGAELALYRSFAADTSASLERCESALLRLKRPSEPLVLWQGGAKTVGFLSALRRPDVIDAAIDANPNRQDVFLPVSALPVYAPRILKQLKPRHVILMNPAYHAEVAQSLRALELDSQLHMVGDLLQ